MDSVLNDSQHDVVDDKSSTTAKVYDESELLGELNSTTARVQLEGSEELRLRTAQALETKDLSDSMGVQGEAEPIESVDEQTEILRKKMEAFLRVTTAQLDQVDFNAEKDMEAARTEITKAMEAYNCEGPPTRAEVDFLRKLIVSQHFKIRLMSEEHKQRQKQQLALVDAFIMEAEKVAKKEKMLREKLEELLAHYEQQQTPATACLLCQSPRHIACQCMQFPNAATRQEEFLEQRRCFNCVKIGHDTDQCTEPKKWCKKCPGQYHQFYLCPIQATTEKTITKVFKITEHAEEKRGERSETKAGGVHSVPTNK